MNPFLVADAQPAVRRRRAVRRDPQHEERHGVELAATADGEAESAEAALQLHRVVLVVQLQQVHFVVLLECRRFYLAE